MSILLSGLDDGAAPIATVSVLVELGSALHVLADPGHHGATAWAHDVRPSLSPALADQTAAWAWTTRAIRARPFVTVHPQPDDFGHQVDLLRSQPDELARGLLRPISPDGDPDVALRWARSRGPAVTAVVEGLVQQPTSAASGFVDFLVNSWQEWFAAEWARVRPDLATRSRRFADSLGRLGPAETIAGLDPSITRTRDPHTVSIAKVQSRRHDLAGRRLLVAPSAFIAPHVYVADTPGHPLLLVHAVEQERMAGRTEVPTVAELMRRLEVVANPGRLEVARAIATEPRTAGEIASLWNIDATLVNRHLRALAEAGLAQTERHGRFVRYSLATDTIRAIGTDLYALLLR